MITELNKRIEIIRKVRNVNYEGWTIMYGQFYFSRPNDWSLFTEVFDLPEEEFVKFITADYELDQIKSKIIACTSSDDILSLLPTMKKYEDTVRKYSHLYPPQIL